MATTWIDLSKAGVVIGRHVEASGRVRLAAVDSLGEQSERLAALGFAPEDGGVSGLWLMLPGQPALTVRRAIEIFGEETAAVVELDDEMIERRYRRAREMRVYSSQRSSNAHPDAMPLGMNASGLTVYSSPRGRFFNVRNRRTGMPMTVFENDAVAGGQTLRQTRAAAFLYADDEAGLSSVTDGFVNRMLKGERLTQKDFNALVDVVGAGQAVPGAAFTRRDVQESIEGSMSRAYAKHVRKNEGNDEFAYKLALRLYEAMPSQQERTASSVANQQFSTPWPISFIAQKLLGDVVGKSVFEPTIGNRSLVSALPSGVKIYGVELDRKRLDAYGVGVTDPAQTNVIFGDATKIDFLKAFERKEPFDAVIANPPFGSLDTVVKVRVVSPLIEEIETKRLDHLILLRSLAARAERGRSVFIVGADHAIEDGQIRGRSRWLLNYLNDHYELDGVADISGNLYQKMGAAFPIRLIVVGARKPQPVHEADFPNELVVLKTHDEVFAWASERMPVTTKDVVKSNVESTVDERVDLGERKQEGGGRQERTGGAGVSTRTKSKDRELIQTDDKTEIQTVQPGLSSVDEQPEESVVQQSSQQEPRHEDAASEQHEVDQAVADALSVDGVDLDPQVVEDDFQRGYEPFSKVGEAKTMIPVNLAGPVYEALSSIQTKYGGIDEFVGQELEFSFSELSDMFSPEQVDALALAIAAKKDGRGFLLADQMGVGKGRTLAAMARHARLHGEVPCFITHKPNLFSDFFARDLEDIKSRHLFSKPFIFNADAKIVDRSGTVIAKAGKPGDFKACFESGRLPEGSDIVFLTYSQIAREETKSHRAKFLLDISSEERGNRPMAFLLDESHNGAGDSWTSENLCKALFASDGSVVYSSGTPIKGAKNLRLYSKVLPRGLDYEELLQVVEKDPISLQEALNHEIALSGCLISRELDNRNVVKDYVMSEQAERNQALSDAVSEILTAMSYLSGDVENIVDQRKKEIRDLLKKLPDADRQGSRLNVSSMNFGSRFHAISRQFLLAVKADDCVQEALRSIERGEKPIVALQHTGESLLMAAINDATDGADEDGPVGTLAKGMKRDRPITFKDLLHRYLARILWIKETGHYGQVSYRSASSPEAKDTVSFIGKLIDALPEGLTLTPIDYFKHKMNERGYRVGEISGRSLQAQYLGDGSIVIESANNTDKSKVVKVCREFNTGDVDAVVLTASGSTGISLQASPANGADVRPRRMIKWEPQQDIAVERQMDGRHNRTGQVVEPRYSVLLSGLPADDRLAMMFNNKNRSLTSATVANRDSKEIIRNVPDLLNEVGDYVAEQLLKENAELAKMMDVAFTDEEQDQRSRSSNFFINRLTGRIMLLPYARQVDLYAELGKRFNERIEELTAMGENPLTVKCHDWSAKVVDRSVFAGEENAGKSKSQFDEPVYLTTIEYQREMNPMRVSEIEERIKAGRDLLMLHPLVGEPCSLREVRDTIVAKSQEWLQSSVSIFKFKSGSVEEALNHKESNETKILKAKLDWLVDRLESLGPGGVFHLEQDNGELTPYVILSLQLPIISDLRRLGTWGVFAVKPGFDQIESMSLNALYVGHAKISSMPLSRLPSVMSQFDDCPKGTQTVRERLLDGNIFEAVATSMRNKIGRKIVYTDEGGIRQHGVLLKHGTSVEALKQSVPERIRKASEVLMFVELLQGKGHGWDGLTTSQSGKFDPSESVRLFKSDAGDYVLTVPGTKAGGGHVFLDPRIAKIEGREGKSFGLSFEGNRNTMRAYIKPQQIMAVVEFLVDEKNLSFYSTNRDLLAEARKRLHEIEQSHATESSQPHVGAG